MVDPHLLKQWKVTEALLMDAKRSLQKAAPHLQRDGSAELAQFEIFIRHNELGLALEVLAELGESLSCGAGFWRDLERAAEVMELREEAAAYHQTSIRHASSQQS